MRPDPVLQALQLEQMRDRLTDAHAAVSEARRELTVLRSQASRQKTRVWAVEQAVAAGCGPWSVVEAWADRAAAYIEESDRGE